TTLHSPLYPYTTLFRSKDNPIESKDTKDKTTKVDLPFAAIFKKPYNFIRSTLLGVGIGILPGIGGGTANIIAYVTAKIQSKTPRSEEHTSELQSRFDLV